MEEQGLEIPSDLPGFGRERDRGARAAAIDMLYGLHEDVWALGPRLGPQSQGALHDVYVAALMAGTPLAPYGI